jgi:hypothetical protein
MRSRSALTSLLLALAALTVTAGCGDDDDAPRAPAGQSQSEFERTLDQAAAVKASDFPAVEKRTLQELADSLASGPIQVGLATSEYTPGENRIAFGLIDQRNSFVYGRTALYVAATPDSPARGPYPAPAYPLIVEPPFRSRGTATEDSAIAAIYSAQVPLPKPGRYALLAVTKVGGRTLGGGTTIAMRRNPSVVQVGQPAPRVETETLASAGGNVDAIETRDPADTMHETSLTEVLGKKPVALLFATPALCQTRVCGPVTDIAEQLKAEYGDRMEFIHQEVYEDNQVGKGLREPLRRFGLRTEPWLFVIDRDGNVTARLEGSFGVDEFENAIRTAL